MNASIASGFVNFKRTPCLEVLSGMHTGSRAAIEQTVCRIGTGSGCDILLRDDGIAAEHVTLRRYGNRLAVEALASDIQVAGHTVARGSGVYAKTPVEIDLGNARVRVSREDIFTMSHAARRRLRNGVSAGAACVVLAGVLYSTIDVSRAFPAHRAGASGNFASATGVQPSTDERDQNALRALENEISDQDLGNLQAARSDDRITVTGKVTRNNHERWIDTQKWFDQKFGRTTMLNSAVQTVPKMGTPDLHFEAAWFGDDPYVVGTQGKRLYPGAALGDGWVLDNLRDNQITVRRDGRTFTLTQ